jgi:general secretion pathway protein D
MKALLHLLLGLCLAASAFATGDTPPATAPAPAPGLRFNFRGAPLEQVLNYLSDAAGLVIVLDTPGPVRGTVDMWSTQPVSPAEAVSLLNHALNQNGCTATLQGRSLVISTKDAARRQDLPVRTGNDPAAIPPTADMVTQIIPLRQIGAAQAAKDIATLIPESTAITANDDSNSLIVTDTQINVRHIVELVSQLDGSTASDTELKIFRLRNADATEMAGLITNLYSADASGSANAASGAAAFRAAIFSRFASRGSRRGGPTPGGSGSAGAPSSTHAPVPTTAIADPRTNSVVVTAARETLAQIGEIIRGLDTSDAQKQHVHVYSLENADVQQVEAVLKELFPSTTTNNSSSATPPDALTARAASNTQQTSGTFLNNANGPQ